MSVDINVRDYVKEGIALHPSKIKIFTHQQKHQRMALLECDLEHCLAHTMVSKII